ncbi:hypothetical protein NLK61_00420 [Pseudomonas fuscovaginae UPB0736]|uniref:DUF2188 domain-containing protein n=1 Tax=Pseudomonas asplenii TaxID=53407 RepID=A0A1H1YTT9_9PSED|nr:MULTISPECIES: hypothetical protein [Pseudomonas]UUQ65152.1 hypothetical protein NLK61_00420 [Pseudomonas fuscovaginae UPB0736]UZE31627.1 hypothetical protein LOY63_13210 [Pseudomonas asplenii]SDT24709.1 hypothetical protein SAMN05216598_4621 [Pseudomonas asplenii]SEI19207.1 hypothetical protein SAMN05216581_3901 [Pseudomonas fuscovaginae]
MSAAKKVNGYLITQAADGQWWVAGDDGEQIAGPFATEALASEVASVFEDTPAPSAKRREK